MIKCALCQLDKPDEAIRFLSTCEECASSIGIVLSVNEVEVLKELLKHEWIGHDPELMKVMRRICQ